MGSDEHGDYHGMHRGPALGGSIAKVYAEPPASNPYPLVSQPDSAIRRWHLRETNNLVRVVLEVPAAPNQVMISLEFLGYAGHTGWSFIDGTALPYGRLVDDAEKATQGLLAGGWFQHLKRSVQGIAFLRLLVETTPELVEWMALKGLSL